MTQITFTTTPLKSWVFAIRVALASSLWALNSAVPAQAPLQRYQIASNALNQVLNQFAAQSGVAVAMDGKQLAGIKSSGLEGMYSIEQGFAKILEHSPWQAKKTAQGYAIVLKDHTPANAPKYVGQLPLVEVSAEGADIASTGVQLLPTVVVDAVKSGSAQEGYLVEKSSNIGPWRGQRLQDTPYAINVMSSDLIENLQATSTDQLYQVNPTMQVNWNNAQNNNGYVFLRGFQSSTSAFDGIRREKWQYTHNLNVEEFERLETLTGLSGFLYGPAAIGGMMNYIAKRPQKEAEQLLTIGNAGGKGGYYAHADLNIPVNETLGVRVNLVGQDTDTTVKHQNIERQVLNAALDWQPRDDLLLQAIYSYSDYYLAGRQPYWYLASGATRPSAKQIDSNQLWAQQWTYNSATVERYSANLNWTINPKLRLRAAYMQEQVERAGQISSNTIQPDGSYTQVTTNYADYQQDLNGYGAYVFLDYNFNAGRTQHQLTVGLQKSDSSWDALNNAGTSVTLTGLSFDAPVYVSMPYNNLTTTFLKDYLHLSSLNYTLGDSILITSQWSVLLGASFQELEYATTHYKKDALTPSLAIVYKPIEHLSIYANYMEGLEVGGVAAETYAGYAVVNANAVMDPLMSTQLELGMKWSLGDLLLTAALFNIDKGLEYYDLTDATRPRYVQDGRQLHRGLETTLMGKITPQWRVIAGVTVLDAQVEDNKQTPELEGKRPAGVAHKFAKLYLEYLPIQGLDFALNGGVNYTGSSYGDNLNTDVLPSYTLFNVGARYSSKNLKYPITYRVNLNNALDKRYWQNAYFLGDRRSLTASVQFKF
jgi:iron complex outermembrane receptor protein